MSDDNRLDELLDLWEELRDGGNGLGVAEFIEQYCSGESLEILQRLRDKINALEAVNGLLGDEPLAVAAHARETEVEGAFVETGVTLVPGELIVEGYRLISRLGEGGFGEVWKAQGPGGFHVALKFVRLDKTASESELRSLEIVKRLRHPNLLTTFGTWQRGSWLIIASELAGQSLHDRFQQAVDEGMPGIPRGELLAYLSDAAKALDFLNTPHHPVGEGRQASIQHRDVKPQNLLLSGGGVKVADLGIARLMEGTSTEHTGAMSVAYAAPEFFDGKTTDRSDQYSLAVTYCMLRGGHLPFQGSDMEMLKGHVSGTPDLSMLPDEEQAIVQRALSKEPEDRWPSCRDFVRALAKSRVSGEPTRVSTTDESAWKRFAAVTAIAAIAIVAVVSYLVGRANSPRAETESIASAESTDSGNRAPDIPVGPVAEDSPSTEAVADDATESSAGDEVTSNSNTEAPSMQPEPSEPEPASETASDDTPAETVSVTDNSAPVLSVATEILTSAQWQWIQPVNMGPTFNSEDHDASPYMTPDGRLLLFESTRRGGQGGWDLWMSDRVSMSAPWNRPVNLGTIVNSQWDEGAPCLSADGLSLFFHSSNRLGGIGSHDIWVSSRPTRESAFGEPVNLGPPVNHELSDQSPSISPNGLTLYFSSTRTGGSGESDLWMSQRQDLESEWGEPVNLGTAVNTSDTEVSPEISSDGLTLLFAGHTNGVNSPHVLWMANRSSLDQPFGHRIPMGGPLNGWATSSSPTITEDGRYMIFHSNHRVSRGWDLWWTQRIPK